MNNFLEIERSEEPLLNKIQDDLHLKSKEVKDSFEFLKEMELYYTEEELKIFADKIGKFVYIFEIEYKPKRIKWLIRKCYNDLETLDRTLRKNHKIPDFPSETQFKSGKEILSDFELYLNRLLETPKVNKSQYFAEFTEFSELINSDVQKYKEGFVLKRAGGRFNESKILMKCFDCCRCWKRRYLLVTSEGVMYTRGLINERREVRENLLFDHHYHLEYGFKQTKREFGLKMTYSNRILLLEALNVFSFFDILNALRLAEKNSAITCKNRFNSFGPIRNNVHCKWYVDGEFYFSNLFDDLLKAKEEVLITDWWLSPEIYLKRPVSENKNSETMLKYVLKTLANKGISIKIIVYKEPKIALNNDSDYTKKELSHPNIIVLRHPGYFLPTFLWSHHEKMVVIDQKIGFLGGLDLCFGRMDTQAHHLNDIGLNNEEFFPGIDFSNSRIKDFVNVRSWQNPLINKGKIPRMPWHDIAMRVEGPVVQDMARHFIQYWNFAKYDLDNTKKNQPVLIKKTSQDEKKFSKLKKYWDQTKQIVKEIKSNNFFTKKEDEIINHQDDDSNIQPDNFDIYFHNINEQASKISKQKADALKFSEEEEKKSDFLTISKDKFFNRSHTDSGALKKTDFKARKLATYFSPSNLDKVQLNPDFLALLNSVRQLKNEPESDVSDHMSKFTENNENSLDLVDVESKIKKEEIESPTKTIFNHFHKAGSLSKTGYLSVGFKHKKYEGSGNMTCQMLRSASNWSIGLKKQDYECSILLGYLALISGAENFIYIENQFFISRVTTENNNNPVKNMIAEALYLRIKKAVSEKKEFKIIVVMPLLPGFEGEITDPNAALLKIQLHYEYQTISRGGKSLLEMLSKDQEIDDPTKYISFYGLRNHCIMDGKPVTEIIYVHSKLMIVDDKYVIMGSANINDRSMLGKRDSEIAMIVEDNNKIDKLMNGKEYAVGEFAHTLRANIFSEHFGLNYEEVHDPLNSDFLKKIEQNSKKNTEIYRKIFACYPDDNILKINDYENLKNNSDINLYEDLNKEIIGHAVEFPLNFLRDEKLKFTIKNKENLVPAHNFT